MSLTKVNPEETSRKFAFEYLSHQTFPDATLTKIFDITKLIKLSKKTNNKINVLIHYVIVKTAKQIPEFYFLVNGYTRELYKADTILLTIMAKCLNGSIAFCDIIFDDDFKQFKNNYLQSTKYCWDNNCNYKISDDEKKGAIIGTSSLPFTQLECVSNGYGPAYTSPFIVLMKFYKKWFRNYMPISFQFHHLQMDGEHACRFLELLQQNINNLKLSDLK